MQGSTPIIALGLAPIMFSFFMLLFIALACRPETVATKEWT
jgi:hypothetical protein